MQISFENFFYVFTRQNEIFRANLLQQQEHLFKLEQIIQTSQTALWMHFVQIKLLILRARLKVFIDSTCSFPSMHWRTTSSKLKMQRRNRNAGCGDSFEIHLGKTATIKAKATTKSPRNERQLKDIFLGDFLRSIPKRHLVITKVLLVKLLNGMDKLHKKTNQFLHSFSLIRFYLSL